MTAPRLTPTAEYIAGVLRRYGPLTVNEIMGRVRASTTAIERGMARLRQAGVIVEAGKLPRRDGSPGRPRKIWALAEVEAV